MTDTETKFLIHIDFHRNYMNQLLNTFFPSFLLWVLAYSTLLIKTDDFTDRIMVTVTSLLVLVSLLGSVSNDLPVTSYFKYIDLWFIYYVSGIFMLTVYHILLDMVDENPQGTEGNLKKEKLFRVSPLNPKKQFSKDDANIKTLDGARRKKDRINLIGLIIFPVLTTIFNLLYFLSTTGVICFQ